MVGIARATAGTGRRARARLRVRHALPALAAVVLLASIAAPAAGAHGHRTAATRFGVEFRLDKGRYDSHLFHLSDTGCASKTTEEDKFSFDALYLLLLRGKAAPTLDLVDLEPSSWAWSYQVEESGCGGEPESEGTESCTDTDSFTVEPPPADGRPATVRQGSLQLDLQATSGVLIEAADGSARCESKLGFALFGPAGALYMPQMLSARVTVPLAALTKTPKPRRGGRREPDLWTKSGIHLAGADRPPLDCSPDAAGDTCDQHVQWEGSVRIFRMR